MIKCATLSTLLKSLRLGHVPYVIHDFAQALIKSGTLSPMMKTQVMAIQPFCNLFTNWPRDDDLNLKDLRLTCLGFLVSWPGCQTLLPEQ